VILAKMAVSLHAECAAIFMTKPRKQYDYPLALNANCGEEVSKV
jgi:hypothetical protein